MKIFYPLLMAILCMATFAHGQSHPKNDDGSVIDLLVLYNTQTFTQFGEAGNSTSDWIDRAVLETNYTMRNSGVNLRVDLVHKAFVNYSTTNNSNDLGNLRDNSNGLEIAGTLKDQYHADIVILITDNTSGGLADALFSLENAASIDSRYAVVNAGGTSVFVHELGHTLGGMHDEVDASQPNGFISAIFPYAHGYTGDNFGGTSSIGGFQSGRSTIGKVPFYSNPNLFFKGEPLGDAGYGDNVRTFNETAPAVAKARSSEAVWTGEAGSDWSAAGSWSPMRVPRAIDDVVIPAGLSTYPSINGNGTARNLIVAEGAQLSMTTGELTLRGHLIAEGNFQATGGTVIMKTDQDRPLEVQLSAGSTLNNFSVGTDSEPGFAKLLSDVTLSGDLSIASVSALDHNGQVLKVDGNWNDAWGCGFDYSYDQVNLAGEVNVTEATINFPISDAKGWLSYAELGNKSWRWNLGRDEGDLFLTNRSNPVQDRDELVWNIDAWVFTPTIFLAQNNDYEISYEVKTDAGVAPQVSLHYGNQTLPSLMQSIGSTFTGTGDNVYQTDTKSLRTTSAGTNSIGIRYNLDLDQTQPIFQAFIQNFSIKCASPVPEEFGNSEACTDTDDDGICDDEDNCPDTPNPDQADADGNGIGDVCEEDEEVCESDVDDDGICDDVDNCIDTPNPDQADADGNGIGDVCEVDVTCESDVDDDGICDDVDNCIDTPNPDQADADGNGIGDVCEDVVTEPTSVVWQMHHGQGEGRFVPGPDDPSVREILSSLYTVPIHGDPGGYQYAEIPMADDASWADAPTAPEDGQLCFRLDRSNLTTFMTELDFTYFQTFVNVTDASIPFNITYQEVDDGVRAYVFNSQHLDGEYIEGGDSRLYLPEKTVDLSPLFVAGEVNRVVLVQFDNAQTANYLKAIVNYEGGNDDVCADDNEAPVLDLSAITVDTLECTSPEDLPMPMPSMANATDNCDEAPLVTVAVDLVPNLDTTIIERDEGFGGEEMTIDTVIRERGTIVNWTFMATDAAGNETMETVAAYYLPRDSEGPVIEGCPGFDEVLTVQLDGNGELIPPVIDGLSAFDNCDGDLTNEIVFTLDIPFEGADPSLIISVTDDAAGNPGLPFCSVSVTIEEEANCEEDDQAPEIFYVLEDGTEVNSLDGIFQDRYECDETIPSFTTLGRFRDNCSEGGSIFPITGIFPLPGGEDIRIIQIFIATDDSGNETRDSLSYVRPSDCSGIAPEIINSLNVSVAPNPFRGESKVTFTNPADGLVTLEVRTMSGVIVQSTKHETVKGVKNDFFVQGSNLEPGIYMITVRSATAQKTVRAVITQ